MEDIILIADPKIRSMPILENGEPLIEVMQSPKIVVSSDIFCPYQKSDSYTKVRKTVMELLLRAGGHLPNGIRFYLEEGHRSLSVQKKIFDEYYAKLQNAHPEWNTTQLFAETTKYVAPPYNSPPHSTGGAFDITLINEKGEQLDMGAPLNETPDQNQNHNFTFSPHISELAKTNRKILIEALSRVGFVNYPTEWWHWSYGDRYWAYQSKKSFALYDSIKG